MKPGNYRSEPKAQRRLHGLTDGSRDGPAEKASVDIRIAQDAAITIDDGSGTVTKLVVTTCPVAYHSRCYINSLSLSILNRK